MSEVPFIKLVESYRFLYDKKHKLSKDDRAIANAWKAIARAMNKSEDVVMRRWIALRKRFVQQRRKLQTVSPGLGENSVKHWPLYSALQFLNDHVSMRMTSANLNPLPKETSYNTQLDQYTMEMSDEEFQRFNDCLLDRQYSSDLQPSTSVILSPNKIAEMVNHDHGFDGSVTEISDTTSVTADPSIKRKKMLRAITTMKSYFNKMEQQNHQTTEDALMAFGRSIALQLGYVQSPVVCLQLQAQICNLIADAMKKQEEEAES